MTKINIDIPQDLHRKAKSHASIKGKRLKEFVIDCISRGVEDADL